ncbi:MAG: hypothetical protein A2075_04025 [Geobacteraceae bacterium GWC2_58_44]|nr:MAG: hypothetical protein A2075_04025 [Geobacteraceae bacterium GWC2_58_44]HBG05929.1 hypothetical protein [Geobacter sp.]
MNHFKTFPQHHTVMSTVYRTFTCSLLLVLLSALPGWATTYYVKNGGNDSYDGLTDSTAWATIAKVKAASKSGDTVLFRSQDTWSSSYLPVLSATAGVVYDGASYGSGTRAKLRATGGYLSGPVDAVVNLFASNVLFTGFEVDGNAQVTGGIYAGMHAPSSVSNITIDNCVVHDNGGPESSPTKYYYGIHVGSAMSVTVDAPMVVSNVKVINTTVYNTGHEGIAVYPTWLYPYNRVNGLLIRNCVIHDTAHWGGNAWGDGIYFVNDSDNVTIEFNSIYDCFRGLNLGTSTTYTGSPNNATIRYNIIRNSTFAGIVINPSSGISGDASFYGNILYNNGKYWSGNYSSEIDIAGRNNYNSSVFNFYNNTIYSTASTASDKRNVSISLFERLAGTPTINFRNNIVYSGSYTPIRDPFNLLKHSNNLIYRSSSALDEHVNSGTSYNRAGVLIWEPTARNTDPKFVGGILPTGFRGTYGRDLQPNSDYFAITTGDAVGGGTSLASPYDSSINGAGLAVPITRPMGGAYDIGAYQHIPPPPSLQP